MTRTAQLLGLGTVLLATACGDSASTGTATLSGGATGTLAIYALGGYHPGDTFSELNILSGAFDGALTNPFLGFGANFPGAVLQTGTFTSEDTPGQTGYTNQSLQVWDQLSSQNLGAYSLTISSVGSPTATPSSPPSGANTQWLHTHGTFTATLVTRSDHPYDGAVNVTLSF
jgi:hypothetical protein